MPTCIKIRGKKTQVCMGDMRFPIEIRERTLGVPFNPTDGVDVDYTENFVILHSVFAAIDTPEGQTTFNDIGISTVISHVFYVRFLDDVNTQSWIVFENNQYKIVKLTDFDGRKLFLKLECILRGDKDKDASSA